MPLLRLIAEGVGPFEKVDIDLSDGKGKPHLGPHILAGVNGSGKSTLLRTVAWALDTSRFGFHYEDWVQALKGYAYSRALLVRPEGVHLHVQACSKQTDDVSENAMEWVGPALSKAGLNLAPHGLPPSNRQTMGTPEGERMTWSQFPVWYELDRPGAFFNIAAYSPSKALRHLPTPQPTKALSSAYEKCLAFDTTVQNDSVQAWLIGLYSKRAIARERGQPTDEYTKSLGHFEAALRLMYDESVSFEVEIKPSLQPRLRMMGHSLNFSQLPDGVRSTVGWIADFMMRQDLVDWNPQLEGRRPGILLLDEIDAHLHPLWQRRLLPAMREALPEVQIIVTSHSPFVISSCPGSRVHVLELDKQGRAHARRPVDAPVGESVTTTLKEIFGVDSRFDVMTENQLNEWNDLKRAETAGSLSSRDRTRLRQLTIALSERSEELRSIVASPSTLPKAVLNSLLQSDKKPKQRKRA
jgi:predicted ATP-binding protein involved in virulence